MSIFFIVIIIRSFFYDVIVGSQYSMYISLYWVIFVKYISSFIMNNILIIDDLFFLLYLFYEYIELNQVMVLKFKMVEFISIYEI